MENGYYVFERDNHYYLFDYEAGVKAEVSKDFAEIVQKTRKHICLEEDEKRLLKKIKNAGLLRDVSLENRNTTCKTAYLSFAPTHSCNMRCAYCFGRWGENYEGRNRIFNLKTIKRMIDYFFLEYCPAAEQYRIDFVSGGEPLLGFSVILDALNYVNHEYSSRKVKYWLCTNGTLLDEEIINKLDENHIFLGISIDGIKEKHDGVRLDADGKGTYEKVLNGIELLKQTGYWGRHKNVTALCTASNDNCDFVSIIKNFRQIGFSNAQIRLIRGAIDYNIEKLKKEYSRLTEFLFEEFLQGEMETIKMILNNNDQYGQILKRMLINEIQIKRCEAGARKISVCANGDIYPCDSLVGEKELRMGSLYSNKKMIKWKTKMKELSNYCDKCDIKHLCGGECFYNAYQKDDNNLRPADYYCELQRFLVEECICLCVRMCQADYEKYNKLVRETCIKHEYMEMFG